VTFISYELDESTGKSYRNFLRLIQKLYIHYQKKFMKNITQLIILLIFCGSSFSQDIHSYGYKPVGEKAFDSLLNIAPILKFDDNITYPTVFTLNTPPPGNQGGMGACVAWATEYCMYSYFIERQKPVINWNTSTEFSPGFAYHFCKLNNDCKNAGSNFPLALNLLLYTGCCFLDMWPYKVNDCNQLPTPAQLTEARRFINPPSVSPWFAITNHLPEIWKKGMYNYGLPILVSFNVTESFNFMWTHGGIWSENHGPTPDSHAVCVIGYDDNKRMFKCQNSWGTNGGDAGYFWVTYDLVSSGCFQEAYFWRGNYEPALSQ
jgi:hypothetical protein